ncbi:MAG: diguanylate cyclase [Hydrogenophaga sp.]|uniref:diguanylate cyclase n=1 Tax=Hydrogenophaga sp. TaxID=1904254 RepID=UPI0027663A99|nr:diguanylate cyclase [Hydrogenophaga sp.]MDP2418724.1 diguanylate cyclase [Hydrogenophaga sp.]MDZ4186885.1 diguanylate cyclase [Hydrogenophaga sp.]
MANDTQNSVKALLKPRGWWALWAVFSMLLAGHGHAAPSSPVVHLTDSERAYLTVQNPIGLCVDPDWWPFEVIDDRGQHKGMAADLIALVSARTGAQFVLHTTTTWEESVAASQAGKCLALSFLNRTPDREQWLIFTEPLLIDPNVLITREEHPFISDVGRLRGQTIALPKATAMSERIKRDFPNLTVLDTVSENESLGWVSERQADMTLRSLIVAAHTIKHNGWFNLKISGQIPGYENRLSMGVLKSETILRDILNKGVATLTDEDRRQVVDRHVQMKLVTDVKTDYTLATAIGALLVLVVVSNGWWVRRIQLANTQLKAMAETDALTGLLNRNGLGNSFAFDVERALRYGRSLSVIMLDIDHFKAINDDFGHLVGDKVLADLGYLLTKATRNVDTVCRWGGEEFVVICHETPLEQAEQLAERLLQMAREHPFASQRPLTLSAGVAHVQAGDVPDALVARADAALYQAKNSGRNRVCVAAAVKVDTLPA